ncbi:MAG: sulfite exporter TauE/SafE family protein [Gammaproteobacteria bacterium]|nr:sulfite exporter TauE/SafE family protein [Gammaproteobacteria bacterium]
MSITIAASFMLGLLGAGHCLAMCGGLANLPLAQWQQQHGRTRALAPLLVYNGGRLGAYASAGFLLGGLGEISGLGEWLQQTGLSLRYLTAALLLMASLYLLTGSRRFAPLEGLGQRAWQALSPVALKVLRHTGKQGLTPARMLLLGFTWGWLPCGLSYSVLAIAASTASAADGAMTMLAFGLGTLPAMLLAGSAGLAAKRLLGRAEGRRVAGCLLLVAAAWTGLGPQFLAAGHQHDASPQTAPHAHHTTVSTP